MTNSRVPREVFYVRDCPTFSTVQDPSCTGVGAQGLFAHPLLPISNGRLVTLPVQSTINVLNIDLETLIDNSLCYISPRNRHVSLFLITHVRVRLCLHLNVKCLESIAFFSHLDLFSAILIWNLFSVSSAHPVVVDSLSLVNVIRNIKRERFFESKLDVSLRKKLVNCCIWSITLYGAETWTLRKVD